MTTRQQQYKSSGDGGESERLYQLGVGHVLTEQNVKDIANLLTDYNSELEFAANVYHEARQQVLFEIGGQELVDLTNNEDQHIIANGVQRALKHFYEITQEKDRKRREAAS